MSRPEHIAPPEEVRRACDAVLCFVLYVYALSFSPLPCVRGGVRMRSHPERLGHICPGIAMGIARADVGGRRCVWQFYNREEASKYATNSRMREIQTSLTERALELLALPSEDCFVLDVGCGSGLSGDCLTEAGHHWIGCDISKDMLIVAKEQEVEGDVVLNDMGQVRARAAASGEHRSCAEEGGAQVARGMGQGRRGGGRCAVPARGDARPCAALTRAAGMGCARQLSRACRSGRGPLTGASASPQSSGSATQTGATPIRTAGCSPSSHRSIEAWCAGAARCCSGTPKTRRRWSS